MEGIGEECGRVTNKKSKADGSLISTDEQSSDTVSNLDSLLEGLFKTHCCFTISEEEVCAIEKGVETLVTQIADNFFKTQTGASHFESRHGRYELLKVGSFYDGTKNYFPDGFDYIIVLGDAEVKPDISVFPSQPLLRNVTEGDEEKYKVTGIVNTVCISQCPPERQCPDRTHAPAELSLIGVFENGHVQTLQIYYSNLPEREHVINANVSFAVRVHNIGRNIQCSEVISKEFYEDVVKTGHFLYALRLNDVYSENSLCVMFTESENSIIRNGLSRHHIKVLRILKYLINGNSNFVNQGRLSRRISVAFDITSFYIKNFVIQHHYTCIGTRRIGACVLDILKGLFKLLTNEECNCDKHTMVLGSEERSSVYAGQGSCENSVKAFSDFVSHLERMETSEKSEPDKEADMIGPFRDSLMKQRRIQEKELRRGRACADLTRITIPTESVT